MKFLVKETGEKLTPDQVRKRYPLTIFPKDITRWDDDLMKQLKLEKLPDE